MQISDWIKRRKTPGTLADLARRVLEGDRQYRNVEKTLQNMYVLEALIKHDGHQQKAAEEIGASRATVTRAMRSLGITATEVRKVVKHLKDANAGA